MNRLDNRSFLLLGVAVAVVIAILAVFFASGEPDGLESAALVVQGEKSLTGPSPDDADPEAVGTGVSVYSSPLPDYSLGEESGITGGIIAVILGIFVTLALVLGITRLFAAGKA